MASILGSLLGTDAAAAANAAAADTYKKQMAAAQGIQAYGNTLPGAYNQISQAYNPYTSAGSSALNQLMAGLGLSGTGNQEAFVNAYRNLPGYQSALDTGYTAAARALNAGGGLNSGAALKALYQYGSDYENQRVNDYLNRLQGLQGQGLQATGLQTGLQGQGLGAQLATRQSAYGGQMAAAPTIGQGQVAGAQAEQAALGNLLNAGTYLGGAFLGGPAGSALGGALGSYFKPTTVAPAPVSPYGYSQGYPIYGPGM